MTLILHAGLGEDVIGLTRLVVSLYLNVEDPCLHAEKIRSCIEVLKLIVEETTLLGLRLECMKVDVDKRLVLAEDALRRIEVPGFDVDVVTAGIVRGLSLRDGRLLIYVNYTDTLPSCFFCRFIGDIVWAKLLSRMKQALEKKGFKDIIFIDFATRRIIEVD